MIRKAIITSLLLLLTGACNTGVNKLPTTGNIETKAPATVPVVEKVEIKSNPEHKQEPDTSNDSNYKITELNESKSDDIIKFNIKYPQISGLSDIVKQKMINSTLKIEAIKVLKYYEDPYGIVELNIDYEIVLKNPNILSIQYSGLGSVSSAAHPNNLFYTTNINIKSGERLRLRDVINIDENFVDKFLKGQFKALWPEQNMALEYITNEKIQARFKESDSLDNIGTEKQSDVFSYFTTDSLGISISVGHAIGGHAEFEINYQDIEDNIVTDINIWMR
jgi:stress-induced morphogen